MGKERNAIESALEAFRAATTAGRALLSDEPASMWIREASAAQEKLALAHKVLDMLTEAPHLAGYKRALDLLDRASPLVIKASYGTKDDLESLEAIIAEIDSVPLD